MILAVAGNDERTHGGLPTRSDCSRSGQNYSCMKILKNLLGGKRNSNCVELFYWRPSNGSQNFGDHLSHVVVSTVLYRHERLLDEEVKNPRRLLAIGSILHFAKDGDVIWGSGVNGKVPESTHQFKNLDVRAVRGPLTKEFLSKRGIYVPEVYGDPALLLPLLFPSRFRTDQKRRELAVVPNLHDINLVRHDESFISPLLPWYQVVDAIVSSDRVVASSLHGLIIAEAFGIPATYLRLSETEALFKFEDYYQGTGRANIPYAKTLDEAREMGGMPPPKIDGQRLLAAFPIDLWHPQ